MTFQIVSYGYGMTPMIEELPEAFTEAEAVAVAKVIEGDPHRGFSHLREVRRVYP